MVGPAAATGAGLVGGGKAVAGTGATAAATVSGSSGFGVGAAPAGGVFAGASTLAIAGVVAFMALWTYKLISFLKGDKGYLPPETEARLQAAIEAGTVRTSVTKTGLQAR